ncbi:MAG TPA: multicopper oxidase family protein [Vicinamibacterales bacterium]|nr:multicopper oxidase family protein [Vicinamibacterales bacterium]
MRRRDFLYTVGAASIVSGLRGLEVPLQAAKAADHTIRITKASIEPIPGRVIQTTGYNGTIPGPMLRLKQGVPVTIDLVNEIDKPEFVHWHGLSTSVAVDGSGEEGSPVLAPGARRRVTFTPREAGLRWYHTHSMAMADMTRGAYSGQFGFLYVEPKTDPGRYDQEIFLAGRHWEPKILHRGAPNNDWTVDYGVYTLGEHALGHGEPIRVREGQRVLFHLLNASATRQVNVALPGHKFQVIALDGNPVPTQASVDTVVLAVAERADVVVEMNNPGVWVMGATRDQDRMNGMGVVIEYAGRSGEPQFVAPKQAPWDYTMFAAQHAPAPRPEPDGRFELEFHMLPDPGEPFNRWTVNGKSWPDVEPLRVKKGKRYRIALKNGNEDGHPVHLHRHLFDVVSIGDQPVSGLTKDTINVPRNTVVEVDLVADNPGNSLIHCHMQQHMDYGFKAMIEYV